MSIQPTPEPDIGHGWRDDAACLDQPSEWFTDPAHQTDIDRALATCATCAVRTSCLTTALSQPEYGDVGIWGGTTASTRNRIRTGQLTADEVWAAQLPVPVEDTEEPTRAANRTGATREDRPSGEVRRLPVPELTVAPNQHGDYVSADGRTVIFRIHGDPPWMLAVDDRCIARTDSLTAARRLAWTTIHDADTRPEPSYLDVARSR